MSSSSDGIKHGYSTIRAVLDDLRGRSLIIGLAAWDADSRWYRLRAIERSERVAGLPASLRGLADVAVEQVRRWADRHDVPYAPGRSAPWTSEFWSAASRVMTTAIRLDPPRAMTPLRDHEVDFESLFDAVVQPATPARERARRIDGLISSALGDASKVLKRGAEFTAFGGVYEAVLRGAVGATGGVVVEGVNLAGANARRDADALVSRLLRIQDARTSLRTEVIVGYIASPGGLNGETDMRDWIRAKVTEHVYDLVLEEPRFQSAAEASLAAVGVGSD